MKHKLAALAKRHVILLGLLGLVIVLGILEPALLSFRHFRNILFEAAPLALLGASFAFCAIRGCLDISLGRCAAFAGIVAASLLQSPEFSNRMFETLPRLPVIVPLILGMFLCAGFSALHFFGRRRLHLSPVLSGLVFAGLFQGILRVYLARKDENDRILAHFVPSFAAFGSGFVGADPVYSIPWVVVISIVCCAAFWALSSRRIGFKVTLLPGMMAAGACCALAGVMIAAKTAEIDARFMSGVDFGVFAGVLAGGVSVYGGKGSVLGALAGVFLCTGALYMLDFIYPVSGTGALLQTAIVGIALALEARQH